MTKGKWEPGASVVCVPDEGSSSANWDSAAAWEDRLLEETLRALSLLAGPQTLAEGNESVENDPLAWKGLLELWDSLM